MEDFRFKMKWFEIKTLLTDAIPIDHDVMHIHVGLAAFLVLSLLFRNINLRYLMAIIVILSCQMVNEVLDALDWLRWTGKINWAEGVSDTLNTIFWPCILAMIFSRLNPGALRDPDEDADLID